MSDIGKSANINSRGLSKHKNGISLEIKEKFCYLGETGLLQESRVDGESSEI